MSIKSPLPVQAQKRSQFTRLSAYLIAVRPQQWTKNLIVFAAPLFAYSLNLSSFVNSFIAFILFCAISSSFYLFNDLIDVEADRQHPIKCHRPIAAGLVNIPIAILLAFGLLFGALLIGWLRSPRLGLVLLSYALLQVAYNVRLKRMVILDIGAISAGFVLRAYAGAVATQITLSPWFLICTAMLALFLAVEKRKAELRLAQLQNIKPRAVLRRYSLPVLSRMENVVTTGTVMTYTLWSSGPYFRGASTSWMLLTLPFVLYGVFRYQLISDPQVSEEFQPDQSERPEEVLLRDLSILFTVVSWALTCFVVLWLKHQNLIG
jgi:decaprenyl-phosphate phosphoribosyltransferase